MNNLLSEDYKRRLKDRLYGLLCEFEKEGNWEKYLDSILIELLRIDEESKNEYYYILWRKISSLRYLSYKYFRTTIFDCMNFLE